ncbi:MAG TPA: GH116 family glycosyl-hydrolase [Verrucomicrobiae bacterium]|nr:GH116 family glycosyl-hydrolase [Verrucomicrobiae bacterium]
MAKNPPPQKNCSGPSCGCRPQWGRRDFLKLVGVGALGAAAGWPAMAGPFTRQDFERLVPADKKLHPDWVRSLAARGERTVYRGAELEYIGMPIGGICAGQLYLGGDGRLWHWDIFNQSIATDAAHYAHPPPAASPVDQGFALRVTVAGQTTERRLDRTHWRDVAFTGEYPIGFVEYRDPDCPVTVNLEAFSPFIPLNTEDSSLPATVLEFTVQNNGLAPVEIELAGWLENAVCRHSGAAHEGWRRNRLVRRSGALLLEASVEAGAPSDPARPDIVFDDFEDGTYRNWHVTGTAFGSGPVAAAAMPAYQGDVHAHGKRLVNTHASAPGTNVGERDAATGKLVSRSFALNRNYLTFLIGGGAAAGQTCMNLRVAGQIVLSATGHDDNRLQPVNWDVRPWAGQSAVLEIVDDGTGGWGNIGVDDIVLRDQPRQSAVPLAREPDCGTLVLGLLATQQEDFGQTEVLADGEALRLFNHSPAAAAPARQPLSRKLVGAVGRRMRLAPGASGVATFLVAWHMPNLAMDKLPPGRHYATRFASALAVARYVAREFPRLSGHTRRWHRTWYDSSLPYWFLDRTFLNTSILASSTCHRFGDGRFYGWEGVGCCAGTCGHVWHYAHAVARLFPDLERRTREAVDFGLAQQPDGAIHFRGEFNDFPAVDGQAGCVLRALREHQMAPDAAFLRRNWPHIRRATEWLMAKDHDADGILEGNQHNTLDTDWFGPVAWLSGLYLAALAAAEVMADEAGDADFAIRCRRILKVGRENFVARLYEDGYFVNRPDPRHLDAINSGSGCEIDQVFGQSWAFQVGLPRVLPETETRSALRALWRYNFTPDVGPYRAAYRPGRWYAMPGEAGLLMCTFPRSDWDYAQAKGKGPDWAAGYFDECMNGFEYQVAGHMLWEGMITEGLAITRAVHDRYHASKRNPWNEVECGDHYARSMASYGVYLAACGYEHHRPQAQLAFAPRLAPEDFKAAFTTATGWGSFAQQRGPHALHGQLRLEWGRLTLRRFGLTAPATVTSVCVTMEQKPIPATLHRDGERCRIEFHSPVHLVEGDTLEIRLS